MSLPPAAADLARRQPVWQAWSSLYLDTGLSPAMQAAVARTLAESGYSDAQLLAILWDEVHPACVGNVLSPAGEWAAFDAEWLSARILAQSSRRWPAWLDPTRRRLGAQVRALMDQVTLARARQSRSNR